MFFRPETIEAMNVDVSSFKNKLAAKFEGMTFVDSEAEATHVIFPNHPQEPDGADLVRPVLKHKAGVLFHWFRLPDSYDSYSVNYALPDGVDVEQAPKPKDGRWKVILMWLKDSDRYLLFD